MVSTRPTAPRVVAGSVGHHLQLAGRAIERRLPGSRVHSDRTRSTVYVAATLQLLLAVLYAYLALSATDSRYLPFLPSTDYLFWIPVLVATGGFGLSFITLLGSVSAGWLVALVNLPLAMTALYVDNVLLSFALVAALLASAAWLGHSLLTDAQARQEADD